MCVGDCPIGLWANDVTNECDPCHSTCAECTGPEENNCIRCEEPRYLQEHFCVDPCTLDGVYANEDERECKACHATCAECNCG